MDRMPVKEECPSDNLPDDICQCDDVHRDTSRKGCLGTAPEPTPFGNHQIVKIENQSELGQLFVDTNYIHFPIRGAPPHYGPLTVPGAKKSQPGLLAFASQRQQFDKNAYMGNSAQPFRKPTKRAGGRRNETQKKKQPRQNCQKGKSVMTASAIIGGADFSCIFNYYNGVMEGRRQNATGSKVLSQFDYLPIHPRVGPTNNMKVQLPRNC